MVESESTTILFPGHLGQVEVRVHLGGIDHADIHVAVIHQVRALFPFFAFQNWFAARSTPATGVP